MDYNDIRVLLEKEIYSEAAKILAKLFISKPSSFRKRILLMNILPEPMSQNYEKRQYILGRFKKACMNAEKLIVEAGFNVSEFINDYKHLIKAM